MEGTLIRAMTQCIWSTVGRWLTTLDRKLGRFLDAANVDRRPGVVIKAKLSRYATGVSVCVNLGK